MAFYRKFLSMWIIIFVIILVTCNSIYGADDYPYRSNPCTDCIDSWGFYIKQCTSYVAWRMNRDAQTPNPPYSFYNAEIADNPTDSNRNRWSHAWHWDEHAIDLGITVSATPVVGAVAQWNENEIGGGYGHVAYVEKIYSDGNVDVSEYNVNELAYGTRKTKAPRYIYINASHLTIFNFNNNFSDGWTAGNAISNQSFENGKWVFNTAIDPYVVSPRLANGINAGQFKKVEVSLSVSGNGRDEVAYIYFDTGSGFNDTDKFYLGEVPTAGQSQLYVVSFPQNIIDQNRPLQQIRLDPLYSEGLGYTPNDTVKVDFIRLISDYYYWYFQDSPLGWSLGNAISEGFIDSWAWKIMATTGDPQLKSPWLGSVNTGSYDTIHLRFAVNRDQDPNGPVMTGKVYFDLYDDGIEGFDESLHSSFSVLPDSSQHDYYVSVPSTSNCTKIHRIRVDFYEGAQDETYPIYIDRIKFMNGGASANANNEPAQLLYFESQSESDSSDSYITIHEISDISVTDNSQIMIKASANGCCSDEYNWSFPQNPLELSVDSEGQIIGNSGSTSGLYAMTIRAEDKYDSTNFSERTFNITVINDDNSSSIRIFNDGTGTLDISDISKEYSSSWINIDTQNPFPAIAQGAYRDVFISIDRQELTLGNYSENIIINSNDCNSNPLIIPVSLHIDTDSTAPPAPQNITITPASWFSSGDLIIDWLNPTDPSGIFGAYYKIGSPPNSDDDGIFVSNKPIQITPSTDGTYMIYLWLVDGAGNKSHQNSDAANYYFDASAPSVISKYPDTGAVDIPVDTDIFVNIEDVHAGIEMSSIILKVNGVEVSPVITGSSSGYSISYKPSSPFNYAETVAISIKASDFSSPSNEMTPMAWSFDTALLATAPTVNSFYINYGDANTNSRTVVLNNSVSGSPTEYMASELVAFSDASWQPYSADSCFLLSSGNGTKTVYFKVKNIAGESNTISDTIILNELGGKYSLSNGYVYLSGIDGYLDELKVDPDGAGNYGQNIINTTGRIDWFIDGSPFSNENTTIQIQEQNRIVLNNQAGALWDINLNGAQLTSSLNIAYAPTNVQVSVDMPYEDSGYFDYAQRYHWEYNNNHDATDIPFKTFYSQTGNTRTIEYFMRNNDDGNYMRFRTNLWDDTQGEPASGNNRLIAIGTGIFDIDFNNLPSHRIWMEKTSDTLTLCSGQDTNAQTINFDFEVTQFDEDEGIDVNENGDKMPYFYTSANEAITNAYGGEYTFDELLNRFYRQSAFYYTDVGLNIWWNWASQYTGFVNNWYRNKLKANLETWEQGDDSYGHSGYMWSWPGNREWPMGDLYLTYDFRFLNTNALFVQAVWNYYAWTGDDAFLGGQLQRLRDAMQYQLDWLGGGSEQIINGDNNYDSDHGGIHNEDVGTNYWDIMPFGGKDAYCSIDFYKSLEALARIEYTLGNTTEGDSYTTMAEQAKTAYNATFWSTTTNRYIGAIDRLDNVHDYGFSFVNIEALAAGLGDPSKVDQIYNWLDSGDIYDKWNFAPRTNVKTTQNLWRIPNNNGYVWEQQLQDGGANLYVSGYDVIARAKYINADDAYNRLKEVLARYSEPDKLTGGSPTIFNETIQGGSDGAGSLGVMSHEFPESGIAGSSFVYAFIGLEPEANGLHIDPRIPTGMEYIGAKNINYRGMNLNFHITNSTIHIECNSRIDEISTGNSYYVINNQQKQFPSGVFSIVEHKCEGDFDLDGDVDDSDLAVFVIDFGRTDCATGDTCEGDFDSDGDVDGSDLVVFAMNFERMDCP